MSEPSVEQGLRITKYTRCRVGAHVFTWFGPEPPRDHRCDCGLTVLPPVAEPTP